MTYVRGSRAVETYLRNFKEEDAHDQEILEMTLCYGVQCLSESFSLRGLSCHELRTLTGYEAIKTRDFYVRNVYPSVGKEGGMRQHHLPMEVWTKPSHAWRDGEVEMPDFSKHTYAVAEKAMQPAEDSGNESGAVHSLPRAFDEIDYLTKLLGKSLIDLTWQIFTGKKGLQITTREELDEQFLRVDQRKTVATIPPLELPVASFAAFLGTYVTECVRQSGYTDNIMSGSGDDCGSNSKEKSIYARRGAPSPSSFKNRRRQSASTPCAAMGYTKPAEIVNVDTGQKQRPLLAQPQQREPRHARRSFQHVQSKTQPELQTRRQKLLPVKKTQSQRMSEALARTRLAEYDARRKMKDVRDRRLAPKKIPISDITMGAAALEIVDDFMKSSLMDTFGRGDVPVLGGIVQPATNPTQPRSPQEDSLENELYDTTALDNSFLGCMSGPRHRPESQTQQPSRKYDGWLGDFGPLHTKTVQPEWNEDDAVPKSHCLNTGAIGTKFEWNFGHLPRENADHLQAQTRFDREKASDNGPIRQRNDFDDSFDALSEISDPVFRWLKGAV